MNKLEKLLARQGLQMKDLELPSHEQKLLNLTLSNLKTTNPSDAKLADLSEEMLINHVQQAASYMDGIGRGSLVDPRRNELPLSDMDDYIRGIVRWLNELGIYTSMSCDGHDRRAAMLWLIEPLTRKEMDVILTCTPDDLRVKFHGKKISLHYPKGQRKLLLDTAERLYQMVTYPDTMIDIEASKFKSRLVELLHISGESGKERNIRKCLDRKLQSVVDYTYVDGARNLLAYRYFGEGPTILLSAHMDTFEEFEVGRSLNERGTTLTSSAGILGADDRAGIAVILELLYRLERTNFNGTIKVAFTVKEEIGCVGSQDIDTCFLEDVNSAIVIDRRGTRDIVTSYADIIPFCSESYGKIFEQAGKLAGMPDWKITAGGLSDARSFAEKGIPSVNLSAGYMHEHTDAETVDYKATFETVKLIETALHERLILGHGDRFVVPVV
ncbi:M20/M25/M40 family metallo-hydrolase [Aquibacillus sediminis]|uniref:M20/M25/M40 family metallo-hydrolase n=1 Tax=Aquibacillus sediminis TaxID=2574734 RepID=UPI00110918FC|nr:M20/M25/M40 family metallo-hydrolase [Aquibacillus sediminis]